MIYLIGSLRNPEVPRVSASLRAAGFHIFDDWFAAGPIADDSWRDYEKARGHTFQQALSGAAAKNVFQFDKTHLDQSDTALLVCPAGKSAHLELGIMLGQGKRGIVYFTGEPERWDVMYQFADAVCFNIDELLKTMQDMCISPKLTRRECLGAS